MPVWLKNASPLEDPTLVGRKIANRHVSDLSVLPVVGRQTDLLQSTHFSTEAAHFAKVHHGANTREGWALEELVAFCAKHYLGQTAKILQRVKISVLECDIDLVESNPLHPLDTINPMAGSAEAWRYEADIVIVDQDQQIVHLIDVKRSLQRSEPDLETLKSIEIAARRWLAEELGVSFRINLIVLRWFMGKATPPDHIAGPTDIDAILGFPVRAHVEAMLRHYREGVRELLRKLPTAEVVQPVEDSLPSDVIEPMLNRIAERMARRRGYR